MSRKHWIFTEIQNRKELADEYIKGYLPEPVGDFQNLIEAMNYGVLAGGKRLRPILVMESYRLFAGEDADIKKVSAFMAAIEFIHTYSLIHDDLPAMDNDLLRRGKPTVHAKYGEAMGILAGDALLNYAAQCVIKSLVEDESHRAIKAAEALFNASGINGMIGGQAIDVEYEKQNKSMDMDVLMCIHQNKTAALITVALEIGSLVGGCTDITQIRKMGSHLGIAFQIRDDILDVTSDEKILGKPIGSDEKNNKTTTVSLLGVGGAEDMLNEHTYKAIEILLTLPGDKTFLKELFIYLTDRSK